MPWFKTKYGLDISQTSFSQVHARLFLCFTVWPVICKSSAILQPHPAAKDLPRANPCPEFIEAVRPHSVAISDEPGDRLFHSHGWNTPGFYTVVTLTRFLSFFLFFLPPFPFFFDHPSLSGGLLPSLLSWMGRSGHTCHELFALRTGKIGRIVDLVVWPGGCGCYH